jgi:hypothetical protein
MQGLALAKFSPASSDQAKLLRILTALDCQAVAQLVPKRAESSAFIEFFEHILLGSGWLNILALAKFSPASSDQAKLLRILTALDYLFDQARADKKALHVGTSPGLVDMRQKILQITQDGIAKGLRLSS